MSGNTKKKHVAFFASGGGSVVECAYNFLQLFPDEVEVPLVVLDSEHCSAVEKFKKYDVDCRVFSKGWKSDRRRVCDEISDLCVERGVDFIFMGFNRLLTGDILRIFHNRIINNHLSLLPAFKGLNAVDTALEHGCRFVGGTTHFIDENMDEGLMIAQGLVPCDDSADVSEIKERHYQMLKRLAVNTLYAVVKDRLMVNGNKVVLEGARYDTLPVNPSFEDPVIDSFLADYRQKELNGQSV